MMEIKLRKFQIHINKNIHPFKDITEEEFNKKVKALHKVDLLNIMEETDETDLSGELACAGGVCEITSL